MGQLHQVVAGMLNDRADPIQPLTPTEQSGEISPVAVIGEISSSVSLEANLSRLTGGSFRYQRACKIAS